MKRTIFSLLVIVVLWFVFTRENTVRFGPGVLAPHSPQQEKIDSPKPFIFKEYAITPLAKFFIKAKIVKSKKFN